MKKYFSLAVLLVCNVAFADGHYGSDFESTAEEAAKTCETEIVQFCGTVNPGGPVGDTTTLSYRISQRNKDRWNALIGFNWEMNKAWSVTAEAGFGGSRENFIAGLTYRF